MTLRKSFRRANVLQFPEPYASTSRQQLAVVAHAADQALDRWKKIYTERREGWLQHEFERNLRSFGIDECSPKSAETTRLTKLSRDVAERAVETRYQSRQARIDRAAYAMRSGGPVRSNRHRDFGIGLGY